MLSPSPAAKASTLHHPNLSPVDGHAVRLKEAGKERIDANWETVRWRSRSRRVPR
jgi:hypothetical protein